MARMIEKGRHVWRAVSALTLGFGVFVFGFGLFRPFVQNARADVPAPPQPQCETDDKGNLVCPGNSGGGGNGGGNGEGMDITYGPASWANESSDSSGGGGGGGGGGK